MPSHLSTSNEPQKDHGRSVSFAESRKAPASPKVQGGFPAQREAGAKSMQGGPESLAAMINESGRVRALAQLRDDLNQGMRQPGPAATGQDGGQQPAMFQTATFGAKPVQRMKFNAKGEPIKSGGSDAWEDEPSTPVSAAANTAEVDQFAVWAGTQSTGVLAKVYKALSGLESPARHEAIARSLVGFKILPGEKSKENASNDLALLGKKDWWKLFIDKGLHNPKESQDPTENQEINALRFDRESSPGYFDAMMGGLEKVVATAVSGERTPLSAKDLIGIHGLATKGTLKKEENSFISMPQSMSGSSSGSGSTTFGLAKEDVVPSAVAFEELAREGILKLHPGAVNKAKITAGDSPMTRYLKRATQASPENALGQVRPLGATLVDTLYARKDAPENMQNLLEAHQKELAEADDIESRGKREQAKLEIIIRLIRALHVGHFFQDANGRLNTVILLNRLLIEEGFGPVIMDDTSMFGGGYSVEQLVGQVRRGMKNFQEASGQETGRLETRRDYSAFSYYEDERGQDIRYKLLHVIEVDWAKVGAPQKKTIADILNRWRPKAVMQGYVGPALKKLGFLKSIDALNLENELETYFPRS